MKTLRFQKNYGYEVPAFIERWSWSDTFGRWGAVVIFADSTRLYTWPEDRNHPSIPH